MSSQIKEQRNPADNYSDDYDSEMDFSRESQKVKTRQPGQIDKNNGKEVGSSSSAINSRHAGGRDERDERDEQDDEVSNTVGGNRTSAPEDQNYSQSQSRIGGKKRQKNHDEDDEDSFDDDSDYSQGKAGGGGDYDDNYSSQTSQIDKNQYNSEGPLNNHSSSQ